MEYGYVDDFSSVETGSGSSDLYINNLGTQKDPIKRLRAVVIGRAYHYKEWWPSDSAIGQEWSGLKEGEVIKNRSYAFDGENEVPAEWVKKQERENKDGEKYYVDNISDVYVFTIYTQEGEIKVWKISKPGIVKDLKQISADNGGSLNGLDIVASRSGENKDTKYSTNYIETAEADLIDQANALIKEMNIELAAMFKPAVINGKEEKPELNLIQRKEDKELDDAVKIFTQRE